MKKTVIANSKMNITTSILVLLLLTILGCSVAFFVYIDGPFVGIGLINKDPEREQGGNTLDESGEFGSETGAVGPGESQLVYQIESNFTGQVYLKAFAFGDYTGRKFEKAPKYYNSLYNGLSFEYLQGQLLQYDCPEANLTITPYSSTYILPTFLSADTNNAQSSDVKYEGDTSKPYQVRTYPSSFVDIETAILKGNNNYYYYSEELEYRSFVKSNYLYLPQSTYSYLSTIIEEKGWSYNTPDIYNKVKDYIRNSASYSLEYNTELNSSDDIVVAFLSTYREGICQHYSAAGVAMFRALGIPARRVDGYAVKVTANELVDVFSDRAHSWIEVYLDGFGWYPLEVTGAVGGQGIGGDNGSGGAGQAGVFSVKPKDIFVKNSSPDGMYGYQNYSFDSRYHVDVLDVDDSTLLAYVNLYGGYFTFTVDGYLNKTGDSFVFNGNDYDSTSCDIIISNVVVYDENGENITDSLKIVCKNGTLKKTDYIVKIQTPTIRIDAASGAFNSTASSEIFTLTGDLEAGDYYELDKITTIDKPGYKINKVTLRFYSSDGKDVTDKYGVEEEFGYLHMYKYELTISSNSNRYIYDGQPKEYNNYNVLGYYPSGSYTIRTTFNSFTEAGAHKNNFKVSIFDLDGKNVTNEFYIHKEYGDIIIDQRTITITTESDQKAYDGKALVNAGWTYEGTLVVGHSLEVSVTGSQTEIGRSGNTANAVVYDSEDVDVTKNYKIVIIAGQLKVTYE